MPSFSKLQAANKLKPHKTSKEEISNLLAVVERDLRDAALFELSADRRFATAYNSVLQLSKIVIACVGYRVSGLGHHETTFCAVELAMGQSISKLTSYFDVCRRKRNALDYDMANVVTSTEVDELIEKANDFNEQVSRWLGTNYPQFVS